MYVHREQKGKKEAGGTPQVYTRARECGKGSVGGRGRCRPCFKYSMPIHVCCRKEGGGERGEEGAEHVLVIQEGAAVLQLRPREDQPLLVRRDTLLVLDLLLHVLDGVRGLDVERDGLAGQGLHEDLHTAAQAMPPDMPLPAMPLPAMPRAMLPAIPPAAMPETKETAHETGCDTRVDRFRDEEGLDEGRLAQRTIAVIGARIGSILRKHGHSHVNQVGDQGDARADVSLLLEHRKGVVDHRLREKELLVHTEVILEEIMQENGGE